MEGREDNAALRAAFAELQRAQLSSWARIAALASAGLFATTATLTAVFGREDRWVLFAGRSIGAAVCFGGYLFLRTPFGDRRPRAAILVTAVFALGALASVCLRTGGIVSPFALGGVLAYAAAMVLSSERWIVAAVAAAFIAALGTGTAIEGAEAFTVAITTIYHLATLAMFVVAGGLAERLRFQAFATSHRLEEITENLRRFLPHTVVAGVMRGEVRAAQEFARRKVTILFVDLVGFTSLTARLEPEDLADVLNEYLREMTAVAADHGGTVDKFLGDAVMVVFGAPEKAEESAQAEAALRAAIAMRDRVAGLGLRWKQRGVSGDLAVRIGVNTGFCTVGVFGSDYLRSYTTIGGPVNVAARLQAEAAAGTILAGATTYAAFSHGVVAEFKGALSLKGVSQPVEAYEIVALADASRPLSASH